MKKTTITVEALKTKNYQRYTVGLQEEIEYENNDDLMQKISELQTLCRKQVIAQIALDSV